LLPFRARPKPDPILSTIPEHLLDAKGYRELLDASIIHGESGLAEFRALRDKHAT